MHAERSSATNETCIYTRFYRESSEKLSTHSDGLHKTSKSDSPPSSSWYQRLSRSELPAQAAISSASTSTACLTFQHDLPALMLYVASPLSRACNAQAMQMPDTLDLGVAHLLGCFPRGGLTLRTRLGDKSQYQPRALEVSPSKAIC